MKVMLRPRTSCSIRRRGMASKSSPAKRMRPPSWRALRARMPSTALASVVLPQPDSPTRPKISPRRTLRLTPSSTLAGPTSVANETRKPSTSSRLSAGVATSDPGIENVAQAVTQKIEAHHNDEDGKPGGEREPPGLGEELARFGDHAAPLGCRGRSTEAEEAERAGGQDGESHADRSAHDDRRQDIGQDVQKDDAPRRQPERDRRFNEGLVLEGTHLGVHEAGEPR